MPILLPGMAAGNERHIVIELRGGQVPRVPAKVSDPRVTNLVRGRGDVKSCAGEGEFLDDDTGP